MQIGFYGAARKVTGSKHLITMNNGRRILLDCGMFQGEGYGTYDLNARFHFNPKTIDYLILSHAHIDHSGLIPRLVSEGFKGKIFATAATRDLCAIMLEDSAEIQEDDHRHVSKKNGRQQSGPLYTVEDVKQAMQLFEPVQYAKPYHIDDEVELLFTDAGHILGSAVVSLAIQEDGKTKRICFSGDVGRYDRRILRDPQPFPQADVMILESTYGDTLHQSRDQAEYLLRQAVIETCGLKGGRLLIPAFSLGRTQDLIYILNKLDFENKIPDFEVFVDSPLATDATEIVRKHKECFDEDTLDFMKKDSNPFGFPGLRFIQKSQDSRALNDYKKPCVIIASSGMLEAGRIRHHIIHGIEDAKNTILLTSYAEPDSLGGDLKGGKTHVEIWDRTYEVKADVIAMDGLSAHADQAELLEFLSCQDKNQLKQIYLVHGEYEKQLVFKDKLLEQGYHDVIIPEMSNVITL
ncbi:MAG: MBL fold metallo-hydrolase [Sphingobacteriales bacterium]|nr:MAG: MBL fold metallo-hydrolase [Sphingobacteriales bacterium]